MKQLTNEKITKSSENLFDFVNYAIQLAKTLIDSGRECRVLTEVHNPAYEVLLEISEGVDSLESKETDVQREELIEPYQELVREAGLSAS